MGSVNVSGFRTRSAIRQTVEEAAQRHADKTGSDVLVFGVMGGYEARSKDRGEPHGSFILLGTFKRKRAVEMGKPVGKGKPAGEGA